jgi:hypothetical protein
MIPTGLELLIFIPSTVLLTVAIYFLLNQLKIFSFKLPNLLIAAGIAFPAMLILSFLSPIIGAVSIFTIFMVNSKKDNRAQTGFKLAVAYFLAAFILSFLI